MADETVEIKITGDSSDLAAAMADVAKRVELLIDALSATAQKFEEVGKDAEKGFGKAKKATDEATDSAKKFGKETDKASKSTATLRQRWESAADQVGRADSAFSAISTVLDQMNPKWAEFARQAADAAAVSEQLILAITQAPKMFTAMTLVVAGAVAAYETWQKPLEETIEKHKALGDAWDKLGKSIANQAKRIREYRQELNLLNGVETKAEQIFKKRMDELKAGEKQQLRELNNIVRKMKNNAKDMKQQERANRVLREGTKNIRDRTNVERELATETFNQAKATEELNKAEEKRAQNQKFLSEEFMRMRISTSILGDEYKVYVKEMTASERAVDTSREAHEKMSAGLIGHTNLMKALGASFAASRAEMYGTVRAIRVGTDEHKNFEKTLKTLNDSYRENLGIQEDVFVAARSGQHIFGAVNSINLDAVDTYGLLNMAMEENLKKRRAEIAEQEAAAAATRAWVNERNALLESLQNENAALDATLTGPFRELEQAYEAQMEDLDEIIDKYEKSAKSNQKSAALIVAAEEQKALKTREYAAAVNELAESLTKATASEAALFVEGETALEKMAEVSSGAIEDQHQEALDSLRESMESQKRLVEDYYQTAIDAEVDRVEANRLRTEEMAQIDAEYLEKKSELEKQQSEVSTQNRLEDIQHFASGSAALLQGTSDVLMAISQNVDDLTAEQKKKMFYLSQAAAIGEVAISGIVAIANIWEEHAANPVLAGALSAGMAGITAAQMSMLAAEKPSFDIGGVIKGGVMADSPDQVGVNVLPGESVLNRSATERLGEQGVNALNSGKGMGQEIIVVPAYRHFDRFIKDEYRKGGAFRRFFNDAREYPVGQRSY